MLCIIGLGGRLPCSAPFKLLRLLHVTRRADVVRWQHGQERTVTEAAK